MVDVEIAKYYISDPTEVKGLLKPPKTPPGYAPALPFTAKKCASCTCGPTILRAYTTRLPLPLPAAPHYTTHIWLPPGFRASVQSLSRVMCCHDHNAICKKGSSNRALATGTYSEAKVSDSRVRQQKRGQKQAPLSLSLTKVLEQ